MLKQKVKNYLLYIEAFAFLAAARFLVVCFPFKLYSQFLGLSMRETSFYDCPDKNKTLKRVTWAVRKMSSFTLWESKCLDQAIAALKMLERRGIESTLYLGTAKDQQGKFIAHAWLRSGSLYITGAEVMGDFTTVGRFAKQIGKVMENSGT